MRATTSATAGAYHGHEHRKLVTLALVGAYASSEHRADPGLSEDKVMLRAMQRAAHAYDQLAKPRVGQLLPNRFGKAVPVASPDGRGRA